MVLIEYLFVLPFSLEELRRALPYANARQRLELTSTSSNGEQVTTVKHEPFNGVPPVVRDKGRYPDRELLAAKGMITVNRLYLGTRFPRWARALVPESYLYVKEEYYDSYPYTMCRYSSEALPHLADFTIESVHMDGLHVDKRDVFGAPGTGAKDKPAKVCVVDITRAAPNEGNVWQGDPCVVQLPRPFNQRGPLPRSTADTPWWIEYETKFPDAPLMTVFKRSHVSIALPWASKVERFTQKSTVRNIGVLSFRNLYCWLPDWHGMSLDDVHKYCDAIMKVPPMTPST